MGIIGCLLVTVTISDESLGVVTISIVPHEHGNTRPYYQVNELMANIW